MRNRHHTAGYWQASAGGRSARRTIAAWPVLAVLLLASPLHGETNSLGGADGSFESDLGGTTPTGEVALISGLGILGPTEGEQALLMTTEPGTGSAPNDAGASSLIIENFTIDAGYGTLRLDYNFLTSEPGPSYANDAFQVSLVLLTSGGDEAVLTSDTFDEFHAAPWTGYASQSGYRSLIADVSAYAGSGEVLDLVLRVRDVGDGRQDSAVIVDDVRLVEPGAPDASVSGPYVILEPGESFTFDGTGSSDDAGVVSYTWDFGNGWGGSGPIVPFNLYTEPGFYQGTLTVTDAAGNTDTATFTVVVGDVNSAPAIVSSPNVSAAEGAPYAYQVLVEDAQARYGDVMTFALTSAPDGMSISPASGLVSWTPAPGAARRNDVTVVVTDSMGASDSQSFTIAIGPEVFVATVADDSRIWTARSLGNGAFADFRFVDDVGNQTRGVAIADFTGDEQFDLITGYGSNPSQHLFLYPRTSGEFEAPIYLGPVGDGSMSSGTYPEDMAAEDFDNDGRMDVVVSGDSTSVWLLRNTGALVTQDEAFFESSFETGEDGWGGVSAATLLRDDTTAASGDWSLRIEATSNNSVLSADVNPSSWFLAYGSTFRFAYRMPPGTPTTLFFNVVGHGWIVLGSSPSGNSSTYPVSPEAVTLIDDDTWRVVEIDLYRAIRAHWPEAAQLTEFEFWTNSNAVLGQGFWIDDFRITRPRMTSGFDVIPLPASGGNGRGMDAGDADRDGNMDLVRARTSDGGIIFYKGNGAGGLTPSASPVVDPGSDPYGVVLADFDSDGVEDIIANSSSSGDPRFFKGNGNGTFQTGVYVASLDTSNYGSYGAYDFNSDGHQDVVVATYTTRQLRYYPGNGNVSFGAPVLVGTVNGNILGVAAPAGRLPGQPFALLTADADDIEEGDTVTFDASESYDDGSIVSYEWDFGDGTTGSGPNVSHSYAGEGRYTVRLFVQDDSGQSDLRSVTVRVTGDPPVAVADGPHVRAETDASYNRWPVELDGTGSSDPETSVARYEWDFDAADGIGVDATAPAPQHVYTSPGVYTVTLTVYDEVDQPAMTTTTVELLAGDVPAAAISAPASVGEAAASLGRWPVEVDVTASTDSEAIAGVQVSWGDGSSTTLPVLKEDFDDGDTSVPSGYYTVSGTWSVIDDRLHQSAASTGNWAWFQDQTRSYRDFELEVDVRAEGTTDGYIGIAFRNPNSNASTDTLLMYSQNSWDAWRFYDWRTATILTEGGDGWDPGIWYHLRLVVVGGHMQLFVTPEGGSEALQLEADHGDHLEGGVALLAHSQQLVYDNLTVTPIEDGLRLNHVYQSADTYDITVTVTDHAGQSNTAVAQTALVAGDPPAADAGGPYQLTEADARAGRWDFDRLDLTAAGDDVGVERFAIDFGDGGGYTTAFTNAAEGSYFAAGTDLYGYDVADARLYRISAVENGTFIEIVDLATGEVVASNTLNRFGAWSYNGPGDGTYFKVRASKPVVAYLTDAAAHSAFMPSLDRSPVGQEFLFLRDNTTFLVYAVEDAEVEFRRSNGNVDARAFLRAGSYWEPRGLANIEYHVRASGRIAMQTTGANGYTTVPSADGDAAGRLFYFATTSGTTGAFAVFAHDAADVEVFDLDSGASLYTASVAAGTVFFQNGVGSRRLRLVSTGDVEVWAGDTEGGTGIANLGDDISVTGGRDGTEFLLHNLADGIVIFAPSDGTSIDVDGGAGSYDLDQDEFLHLTPADFATGTGTHRITASRPVLIQTLGRATGFNDLGTYLGGVATRHQYPAVGTYDIAVTAVDRAGQASVATTSVEVLAGDLPVPDIDAPAEADESFAEGGSWGVDFDASGSTDDFGIYNYEWDFGDGTTGSGVTTTHQYDAPGTYQVTLRTTDHANQTVSTTFDVQVTQGSGPVADAGGPYLVGEAAAAHGVWTAVLDASGSSDDSGIFDYFWQFPPRVLDDFAAGELDSERWTVSAGTTQSGGTLTVAGVNNWSLRGFYGKAEPVRRVVDSEFRMIVHTAPGTAMAGLFRSSSTNFSYTNMPHAVYFNNGTLQMYENGSSRGGFGSYVVGNSYEIRIVLRQAGASYFIRPVGAADWTALTGPTSIATNELMRPGASVNGGTWSFDEPTVVETRFGAVVERTYHAPTVETVTVRVRDNALQAAFDTATVTVEAGDAPVAVAGGPYTAEVGSFVTFNGTGSSDDNAIESFAWRFGETTGGPDAEGSANANLEYTGNGPNARHFYKTTGTFEVELTVTDNVGQSHSAATTVEVVAGAGPLAAARTPTAGGAGGPPVYFDATPSSDDFAVVEYRWDFDANVDRDGDGNATNDVDAVGPTPFHRYDQVSLPAGEVFQDTFDGAVLDTGRWLGAGATQSGGTVSIIGADNWGNRYLASQQTFPRRLSFGGQVTQTGGNMMFGVKNANTTSFSYTQMPHAVYFNNGTLRIYENGGNRGTVNNFDYAFGTSYDVRIEVEGPGARYFMRESGTMEWTELTGFSPSNPGTAPLRLHAVVFSGTTTLDNLHADSFGELVATLTVEDGAGHTSSIQQTVSVDVNAPPDVITVPWVAFDPLVPHETYDGKAIRLKGIVRDADAVSYQWSFGDGTATGVLNVTNPYDLSVTHTYPDAPAGTPFTATLSVTDSAGNTGSATYPVIVRPLNLTTEINVAIDEGLWYLHQTQTRTSAQGYDTGYWTSNARASATASAIQAFQVNGHLESVSHQVDPYAETVMRGLRQLFRDLGTVAIGPQTHGQPDTNGNGIGIETGVNGSGSQPIYQGGQVMDAIASSGNPLARTVTGSEGILRRSYFNILTDMADQFAWGQVDSGGAQGGWRYSWNSSSDNSAAQWGAIGMLAAEDIFGIAVPQWVKEQNLVWLDNYGAPGWGYTGGAATQAGTPSGLVQMAFDDRTTADPRWEESEQWMADNWTSQYIINPGNRPYYPFYALTKAMRLAKPAPVETFANGFDWFRDPELGLARTLIDDQQANGQFPGSQWITGHLRSAWGVIILSRTVFVQPPVADAGRDRVWGVDIPLTFDGSGSFHLDPFRSLVKYEWDFDGDGDFDHESDEPTVSYTYTRDEYPEETLPTTITVRLRVTDNNIPSLTDTDTVEVIVAVPPHPPVADAGGPYTCTAGLPCALDGSGSFDIDPTDFISLFEWDLDGFPFDYTGASGERPEPVFEEGVHNVSLRVWDNAVLNDLDGDETFDEDERLSDVDFITVTAVANLPPLADANGPYVVDEGSTVALSSAGSSDPNGDPLTFEWDLNDDGAHDDASGPTAAFTGVDDGAYPVSLRVTDTLLEALAVSTVTVENVAPDADAGFDLTLAEGATASFGGSFTDPGTEDTHTLAWDFGDGNQASGTLTPTHSYAGDGVYTVTLTVTDDDGGEGSDSLTVTVTDGVPTAAIAGDDALTEGDTGNYDATASTSTLDPITAYEWDFGYDGSFAASGVTGPTASHLFPEDGGYTVAVRVTDADGSTDIATLPVAVANAAPAVSAGPDQAGLGIGVAAPLGLGTFTDAGILDTHTAGIDWGDGSSNAGEVAQASGGGSVSGSHAYAAAGSYTVTVTVTDDEGASGSDTLTIAVAETPNTPPIVDAGPGATIDEGQTFSGGGSFVDPDDDVWSAVVDYGDGSGVQPLALSAGKTFALSHLYPDDGVYLVTVTVTDDDGASGSDTVTVTVNDLVPTAVLSGDQLLDEGQTGSYDASASTSSPDAIASFEWDWSFDGTFAASGDTGATQSHAFDVAGNHVVAVRVGDDDGSSSIATLEVVVESGDVVLPPAPADLTARPKSTKVQLVWTHSGADSYNVYRSEQPGGPYTLIASTTSTYSTYLDEGLRNGVTYYYVITSVVNGVESVYSNEAAGTPSSRTRSR